MNNSLDTLLMLFQCLGLEPFHPDSERFWFEIMGQGSPFKFSFSPISCFYYFPDSIFDRMLASQDVWRSRADEFWNLFYVPENYTAINTPSIWQKSWRWRVSWRSNHITDLSSKGISLPPYEKIVECREDVLKLSDPVPAVEKDTRKRLKEFALQISDSLCKSFINAAKSVLTEYSTSQPLDSSVTVFNKTVDFSDTLEDLSVLGDDRHSLNGIPENSKDLDETIDKTDRTFGDPHVPAHWFPEISRSSAAPKNALGAGDAQKYFEAYSFIKKRRVSPVCIMHLCTDPEPENICMLCYYGSGKKSKYHLFFLPSLSDEDIRSFASILFGNREQPDDQDDSLFNALKSILYLEAHLYFGLVPSFIPKASVDEVHQMPCTFYALFSRTSTGHPLEQVFENLDDPFLHFSKSGILVSDDFSDFLYWENIKREFPSYPYYPAYDVRPDLHTASFAKYLPLGSDLDPFIYAAMQACVVAPYLPSLASYQTNQYGAGCSIKVVQRASRVPLYCFKIPDGNAPEQYRSHFASFRNPDLCQYLPYAKKEPIRLKRFFQGITFVEFIGSPRRLTYDECASLALSSAFVFLINADEAIPWPSIVPIDLAQIEFIPESPSDDPKAFNPEVPDAIALDLELLDPGAIDPKVFKQMTYQIQNALNQYWAKRYAPFIFGTQGQRLKKQKNRRGRSLLREYTKPAMQEMKKSKIPGKYYPALLPIVASWQFCKEYGVSCDLPFLPPRQFLLPLDTVVPLEKRELKRFCAFLRTKNFIDIPPRSTAVHGTYLEDTNFLYLDYDVYWKDYLEWLGPRSPYFKKNSLQRNVLAEYIEYGSHPKPRPDGKPRKAEAKFHRGKHCYLRLKKDILTAR